MIEPNHPTLPIVRQCALVGIGRSTYYGGPRVEKPESLALMRAVDEQFMGHCHGNLNRAHLDQVAPDQAAAVAICQACAASALN